MARAQNVKSWHCCDGQEHYSFKIILLAQEIESKTSGIMNK
jgi:hypothetical protein